MLVLGRIANVDTSAYDGMLLKPLENTTFTATIGKLTPPRAESSPYSRFRRLSAALKRGSLRTGEKTGSFFR